MENSDSIVILDGAMGTELRARGVEVPDYKSSIWSALALIEAPDEVRRLHGDYIAAGADVITVNNYGVTRKLLKREGMEDRLPELTRTACALAARARDTAERPAKIAASLPPLDTTYRADLVGPFEDNLAAYREMAELLAPFVDMFICETMTTAEEARAAATAAAESGKDIWVSWTLAPDGKTLRGGDSVSDAFAALSDIPVAAFLFNCCSTEAVSAALPAFAAASDRPLGAYSNPVRMEPPGGEPESDPRRPISPEEYAEVAAEWVALGAGIIGGCCDTSPAYTARLCDRLKRQAPRG